MRYAAVLLALLLAGCAAPSQVTHLSVAAPSVAETSFRFIDARIPGTRTSAVAPAERDSRAVFSDDNTSPPPPVLLTTWLESSLSRQLQGKTVQLESFDIVVFNAGASTSRSMLPGDRLIQMIASNRDVSVSIYALIDGRPVSVFIKRQDRATTERALRDILEEARVQLIAKVAAVAS